MVLWFHPSCIGQFLRRLRRSSLLHRRRSGFNGTFWGMVEGQVVGHCRAVFQGFLWANYACLVVEPLKNMLVSWDHHRSHRLEQHLWNCQLAMVVSLKSTQNISMMHPSYFIKHHHLIGYITILSGISMITVKLYTSHIMGVLHPNQIPLYHELSEITSPSYLWYLWLLIDTYQSYLPDFAHTNANPGW